MEDSFRNGEIKTTGTDIERILPPVSRFGGVNRAQKKQTVIDKLKVFFERFFGLGNTSFTDQEKKPVVYDMTPPMLSMVAEPTGEYGAKKD